MRKVKGNTILGVGLNDADYNVRSFREGEKVNGKRKQICTWACPYYTKWKNMVTRCYSKSPATAYIGCTVSAEWLIFSNFRSWCLSQEVRLGCITKLCLDKDFVVSGNTLYSKETCILVTYSVNNFMLDKPKQRDGRLVGANKSPNSKFYTPKVNNPFTLEREDLGKFVTGEEAHLAWKKRKNELALILAHSPDVTDERVRNRLLTSYI